ncbi:hypothetical protein MVI27_08355 [Chryseobacterium salipaludis]|uniref:hypothetical protein n=1 Tax=Chryseobacterium TaxID=59732 RepID=UPI001FF167D8|nr:MULTISPECIES: hypothetical protein [Chryseobacterium]MCJ8498271.1 hypothetical protein [Chryseobacterium salipaludis]MCX3297483.1 hypothetical protein [Planobacterium sp. JC490]
MNRSFWMKFALVNFCIVAVLGVIMRYKILFSLPWLDQKHLQDAHSHFAFYGWITTAIYILLTDYLRKTMPNVAMKKYRALIIVNVVSAFAMLATFIYGGYFWASIAASTAALLCSFVFAGVFYKDTAGLRDASKIWFRSALFFAVISSFGVFNLAYMKMTGTVSQSMYLASEYYFLHFQYNGFFIFSCIGLLLFSMKEAGAVLTKKENNILFFLMFFGCLVGFGLSVLWMEMPAWVFALIIITTVGQTIGALMLYKYVRKHWTNLVVKWSPMHRFVLMYAGFAFAVKTLLQLGSNVPAISQFAFGFRNVVIAYLHLVLLMCIATFLVNQILATNRFKVTSTVLTGLKLLLLGIFLNELILGLMGVFSIKYVAVPYANHGLLAVSVLMLVALIIIVGTLKRREQT